MHASLVIRSVDNIITNYSIASQLYAAHATLQSVPLARSSHSLKKSIVITASMASRGEATVPVTPGMTLAQIKRLPVAVLKLCLDHYHLAHGGNKQTVARRLYNHVSTLDQGASSSENSAHNSETESRGATTDGTFTRGQQQALENTIRSIVRQETVLSSASGDGHSRSRSQAGPTTSTLHQQRTERGHHPSPSPSGEQRQRARKSQRHGRLRERAEHSRRSPSSSTSSSSSSVSRSRSGSSSSSTSPPRHHCRKSQRRYHQRPRHRHHRRRDHHNHRSHTGLAIPRKLRHAITRGEFIDFNQLLSEHLTMSGLASKSSHGRGSAHTRRITGLDTWLEAWSLFAAVQTSAKPYLAPDLFKYQSFIARASYKFQVHAWLQYDAQFRLKLSANPATSWATADPELIATWLSADVAKQKPVCFSCGGPDHLASECPLRQVDKPPGLPCPVCSRAGHSARDCPQLAPGQQQGSSNKPQDNYCGLFNRKGSCFRGHKCKFLHKCASCNGDHPQRSCPRQGR